MLQWLQSNAGWLLGSGGVVGLLLALGKQYGWFKSQPTSGPEQLQDISGTSAIGVQTGNDAVVNITASKDQQADQSQ